MIPTVIHDIQQALVTTPYRYVIRTDVKSYYASIDHAILIQQIQACFDDARVRHYLSQMIQAPIDHGGVFEHPNQGIWPQSSLSGLFAALYLKPLDQRFDKRTDLFYRRYNDDIIILCRTKSQWAKAKRRLKEVMARLKLTLSRTKTYMGPLAHGFHFLGVNMAWTRTQDLDATQNSPLPSRNCAHPGLSACDVCLADGLCSDRPKQSTGLDPVAQPDQTLSNFGLVGSTQATGPVCNRCGLAPRCQESIADLMTPLRRHLACLQADQQSSQMPCLGSCLIRPWVSKLGRDFVQHRLMVTLHKRTIRRAMVKAQWKQAALGSPTHGQHYLRRWQKWWGVFCGSPPT